MIIVQLSGGIGNQMFQYAAGRRLAHHHRTVLKLDTTLLSLTNKRRYELGSFRIPEVFASKSEVASLTRAPLARRVWARVRHRAQAAPPPSYVRQQHFHFEPHILDLPDEVCLTGSWQSPKYFQGIEELLRVELQVKTPATAGNLEWSCAIRDVNAVSLHVRRGDYANEPKTARFHGLCTADYYQRCVAYMAQRVADMHVFVFSDDPEWARDNLRFEVPTRVVDENDERAGHEDLRLMSLCRHHIIANSTFSWWGAWLGRNPNRAVIAPRQWFNEAAHSPRDLIPSDWIPL